MLQLGEKAKAPGKSRGFKSRIAGLECMLVGVVAVFLPTVLLVALGLGRLT